MWYVQVMTDDADRELRAAKRRATYSGQVVQLGEEKPALYTEKTPLERLALQTALVRRLALFSGESPVSIPRNQWPGEVFDIDERNRRNKRAAGRPKDLADVDWLERHPDDV